MLVEILFTLLIIIALTSTKKYAIVDTNEYLNKNFTNNVRGLAILTIMISHCIQFIYLFPSGHINLLYYQKVLTFFISIFTSISVGIFFFLSGYGNWFSLNKSTINIKWLINRLLTLYIPVGLLIIFTILLIKIFNMPILYKTWYIPIINFLTLSVVMWSYWYIKVQAMSYIYIYI